MADAVPTEAFVISAAIDFGTAYSGYAFSLRTDPSKIYTNKGWNADKLLTYKTPTCVLLNSRKQFDSFGYEAENKYVDLAEDETHEGWFLFRRFKMILHNNEVFWLRSFFHVQVKHLVTNNLNSYSANMFLLVQN